MSAGVHHVAVTTSELGVVKDFLHEVLGLDGEIKLSSPQGMDDRQAAGRSGLGIVSRHAPPPDQPLAG